MSLRKLFLALGLLLLVGVWGACVDIPSGPGTDVTLNFRSLVRFLHAVAGAPAGDVKVDGATVANVSFGNPSAYIDIASGSRQIAFGSAAAQTISFGSEQQSTLVIYGDGSLLLNLVEGHKDKNNNNDTTAMVRFVNVASGAASNVAFRRDTARLLASNTLRNAAYGTANAYQLLTPGSVRLFAVSSGGYATTLTGTGTGTTGTGTVDFVADSQLIVVGATVKAKNSEGFFTAARLYNTASGASLYSIPVTTQNMSFQTIELSGDNEVPPVATTATGTGTLTVVNDSSSGGGASYSITTTTPTSMGFFTAAHIHNGVADTNGPVVHTINVAQQKITYPTIIATGSQNTARATCQFTLYRDSLVYDIEITRDQFDTTFTSARFYLASLGLPVKTLIDTAWSESPITVSGKWTRSDSTQPLTDALVDSLRLGRVYFGCTSVGRPLGIIRGDLVPNATHTNTFSGRFTATAFYNLRDEFAFSRTYFNFHTAANPGGEIRGQAVPDTFTTSDFLLRITNAPDSVGRLLNQGNVEMRFLNAAAPGGVISGQLATDQAKGQYSVIEQTFTFETGRMYTVVATGKGSSFQMIKLDDRQVGVNAMPSRVPTPTDKRSVKGGNQKQAKVMNN